MRIVEAVSDHRLTSREELSALEQRLGAPLPDDYVNFLLRHNGGRADSSAFEFDDGNGQVMKSRVDWFFGLGNDESYGLSANLEDYMDRIPRGFLPIGSDPFGNVILLSLAPHGRGSVWFWDHEGEQEEPDLSNMSRLAASFAGFLAGLR